MNGILIESNVYYLPAPVEAVTVAPEVVWPCLSVRLRNAWWRLRLAFAEVRGILRRPRHRQLGDDVVLLEDALEPGSLPRPRRTRPARVLDFEAARLRLRPAGRD